MVAARGMVGARPCIVAQLGIFILIGHILRHHERVFEASAPNIVAAVVEDIFLLCEGPLGARVVVGQGRRTLHTVEDYGVERTVEVGNQHAVGIAHLAAHRYARKHGGRVVHPLADGLTVDMGNHHAVLRNAEAQCWVAHQADAHGHRSAVFGQPQRVADGVGGVDGEAHHIAVEAFNMTNGARRSHHGHRSARGKHSRLGTTQATVAILVAIGAGAGYEEGQAVGVGVGGEVAQLDISFGADIGY